MVSNLLASYIASYILVVAMVNTTITLLGMHA